jgi:pentatricopeptide repeat protein
LWSRERGMIAGYVKCRNLELTRQVFEDVPQGNVVSWNSMIEGYVRHGLESNALRLYEEMQRIHFEAKFVNVCRCFNACCGLAALEQGKQIHVNLIKSLFYFFIFLLEYEVMIETSLVDMICMPSSIVLEDACEVFRECLNKMIMKMFLKEMWSLGIL